VRRLVNDQRAKGGDGVLHSVISRNVPRLFSERLRVRDGTTLAVGKQPVQQGSGYNKVSHVATCGVLY
jgi:hypothetical protein